MTAPTYQLDTHRQQLLAFSAYTASPIFSTVHEWVSDGSANHLTTTAAANSTDPTAVPGHAEITVYCVIYTRWRRGLQCCVASICLSTPPNDMPKDLKTSALCFLPNESENANKSLLTYRSKIQVQFHADYEELSPWWKLNELDIVGTKGQKLSPGMPQEKLMEKSLVLLTFTITHNYISSTKVDSFSAIINNVCILIPGVHYNKHVQSLVPATATVSAHIPPPTIPPTIPPTATAPITNPNAPTATLPVTNLNITPPTIGSITNPGNSIFPVAAAPATGNNTNAPTSVAIASSPDNATAAIIAVLAIAALLSDVGSPPNSPAIPDNQDMDNNIVGVEVIGSPDTVPQVDDGAEKINSSQSAGENVDGWCNNVDHVAAGLESVRVGENLNTLGNQGSGSVADQGGVAAKADQVVPTIKISVLLNKKIDMKEMKIANGSTGNEGKSTMPGQNVKGMKSNQRGGKSSKWKTEGEGEVSKRIHI
ncbi:hypothetical protein EDD85DRAFT_786776 [Armillaria nabsnona]|nr:hypothetical protein EDD85DRAFT_786776 [Armillaria nabsnona]